MQNGWKVRVFSQGVQSAFLIHVIPPFPRFLLFAR